VNEVDGNWRLRDWRGIGATGRGWGGGDGGIGGLKPAGIPVGIPKALRAMYGGYGPDKALYGPWNGPDMGR